MGSMYFQFYQVHWYVHIFALSELSCVLVTNENMGLCLYILGALKRPCIISTIFMSQVGFEPGIFDSLLLEFVVAQKPTQPPRPDNKDNFSGGLLS